jgi:hypothetical protein
VRVPLTIFGLLFVSISVVADPEAPPINACSAKVMAIFKTPKSWVGCIQTHERYMRSLSTLCNQDKTDISEGFAAYLEYAKKYYAAAKKNATGDQFAWNEMDWLTNEWNKTPFMVPMGDAISFYEDAYAHCQVTLGSKN